MIKATGLLCPDIFTNSTAGNLDKYTFVQNLPRLVSEDINPIKLHSDSTPEYALYPH